MIFLHCKKKLTEPNGLHIPGIYPVPKLRDIGRGLGPIVFQVFDVEKFATHQTISHSPHNLKVPLQGDLGGQSFSSLRSWKVTTHTQKSHALHSQKVSPWGRFRGASLKSCQANKNPYSFCILLPVQNVKRRSSFEERLFFIALLWYGYFTITFWV